LGLPHSPDVHYFDIVMMSQLNLCFYHMRLLEALSHLSIKCPVTTGWHPRAAYRTVSEAASTDRLVQMTT